MCSSHCLWLNHQWRASHSPWGAFLTSFNCWKWIWGVFWPVSTVESKFSFHFQLLQKSFFQVKSARRPYKVVDGDRRLRKGVNITFNLQPWTLNLESWILNLEPWTLSSPVLRGKCVRAHEKLLGKFVENYNYHRFEIDHFKLSAVCSFEAPSCYSKVMASSLADLIAKGE